MNKATTGKRHSPDRTIITLFKTQLDSECEKIEKNHAIADRGKQLMWWYLRNIQGLSDSDISEAICDGSGDLGIDAIQIDDEKLVHFYQAKNPTKIEKGIPEGEIDKILGGLRLILSRNHENLANPELRDRIRDIYDIVPSGYRLHIITSGKGIEPGSGPHTKLNAFVSELHAPSDSFFRWDCESISEIQDRHYAKTLPAISDPIVFDAPKTPYMIQSGSSHCYLLHATGRKLAELYDQFGDQLLQRNIRVSQGNTPTNRSILDTCRGSESMNFLHYNNGVTFICDSATYDNFRSVLTLIRAQVVNGGQTIRALSQAMSTGTLKDEVLLPLRVITSNGDKEFGSNVAVNQNNQNQMRPGFLRSNDPRVVQLAQALASDGWYFERREGEADALDPDERTTVEHQIGRSLDDRIIRLKEGMQAYVSTFFRHPELAKKDPKKIFLSSDDGGYFEKVFSPELTAQKMIVAHHIKNCVDKFVRRFGSAKRKHAREADGWQDDYRQLLGDQIVDEQLDKVDQVIPTSAFFLCATIFCEHVDILKKDPFELPEILDRSGDPVLCRHIFRIIEYGKSHPDEANKSWPTLLKSNRFFGRFHSYMQGIHVGRNGNSG